MSTKNTNNQGAERTYRRSPSGTREHVVKGGGGRVVSKTAKGGRKTVSNGKSGGRTTEPQPAADVDEILSAYAESEYVLDDLAQGHGVERHGEDAAATGGDLLARAGRPTVGQSHASGRGASPKRQVRLPRDMSDALDAYAAGNGLTASDVMREALAAYLARRR